MTVEHWHSCIESAAREGRLDLLHVLHKNCKNTRVIDAFGRFAVTEAATHGRLNVLEWLDKKYMIDDVVMNEIIAVGTYHNKTVRYDAAVANTRLFLFLVKEHPAGLADVVENIFILTPFCVV